jgi:hypothetical protein
LAAASADGDVDGAAAVIATDDQTTVRENAAATDSPARAARAHGAERGAPSPGVGGNVATGAQVLAVPPGDLSDVLCEVGVTDAA